MYLGFSVEYLHRTPREGVILSSYCCAYPAALCVLIENNFVYLVPLDSPYRDESNGAKLIRIECVGIKIFKVISIGFFEGLVYVIPTPRSKRITSSVYNLAYTRNFKVKKPALDSP